MKKRFITLAIALSLVLTCTFAIAGCSGGNGGNNNQDSGNTHVHVFATEWSSDATHHWHDCTSADCNEIADKAEHTFVNKKCTICGYVKASEGLVFELNEDGESYILAGIGECTDTDVVVPATYENLPVTEIKMSAFQRKPITSIIIPDSITAMGTNVFWGCTNLVSVTLSKNITSIGLNTFRDCTSLTSFTIPEGVTTIAKNAFYSCTKLERLDIPASITTINEAFTNCKIKEVNVADIGAWCNITFSNTNSNPLFYCNANLLLNGEIVTDLVIPNGVTEIKDFVFNYKYNTPNTTIKSVTIPSSLTKIAGQAFTNLNGIEKINVTDIATWCRIDFTGSSNPLTNGAKLYVGGEMITELVIPEGVTEIKSFAFQYCSQLTSVTLPSTLTTIGDQAFFNCSALTDINFDGTTTEWQGITKNYWLNPTGQCTIHCTDGELKP